jgi:hypothetical protein
MLSQFQASYQRVEQSLQRLTESIAAYNPSTSAADELVAANDAVNEDLDQCMLWCDIFHSHAKLTCYSGHSPN